MATNSILLALAVISSGASAAEVAAPSSCQVARTQPPIAAATSALARRPTDLRAQFNLAEAWSDAGCYNDAVQVLQSAQSQHPGNEDVETRLRVARSLVGEQSFFDQLDRADAEARLKRDNFRCTTLSDLDACSEASRIKPDSPELLIAHADALVRAKRPAEALARYRRAASLMPESADVSTKIAVTEAQLHPSRGNAAVADTPMDRAGDKRVGTRVIRETASNTRQYSNVEQISRSH